MLAYQAAVEASAFISNNSWDTSVCYFIGAFDKATARFVAQVYVGPFSVDPVDYIIGYIADVDHEGHGYVSEAVTAVVTRIFADLEADQIRIHCNVTNERSRRVAERCGFRLDKTFLEERSGPDGKLEVCNTAVYLRLRSDIASIETAGDGGHADLGH